MTPRYHVARPTRTAVRTGALLWLGAVASWNGVSAQVGHEPGQSPYHDVPRGGVGILTFGYLSGSRGRVGVGLSDGKPGGLRYEVLFGAVGASPRDSSGYRFGTTFTIAPNAGLRWYPARRLSVRGDFRLVLWKLKYPLQYKAGDPIDHVPVLSPSAALSEWTSHPWATIGVGWTF